MWSSAPTDQGEALDPQDLADTVKFGRVRSLQLYPPALRQAQDERESNVCLPNPFVVSLSNHEWRTHQGLALPIAIMYNILRLGTLQIPTGDG